MDSDCFVESSVPRVTVIEEPIDQVDSVDKLRGSAASEGRIILIQLHEKARKAYSIML